MKKNSRLLFLTCLMFVFALLTACSSSGNSEPEENDDTNNDLTAEQASEPTEVTFWHAMSGPLQESLDKIVADYNNSQEDYIVKAEFQGSYEELLPKLRSVGGTDDAPAIVQVFEVGTKYMIDSGFIEPMQTFIDKENYDISRLEENILNYYTVDDQLYSMPFNSSTPVMIYNKDAFKEAGLDPEKAPQTFAEIKEAAKKLTNDDMYGFSMLTYGWFFEQLVATQGGLYVDEENGRTGNAEKSLFNGEEGIRAFEFLNDLNKEGSFGNFGTNWDDIRAAFQTGKVAMYMDSSAGVTNMVNNSPFEVGVAYIPYSEEAERHGVVIGGASLWMTKGKEEKEQQAAWDFMKYLQTPEIQARWHVETGYFAINPSAYEEQIVVDRWEEYPQLKVVIDQLQDTKPSAATQGALISVFPESRQIIVTALENLYQGMEPKEALDQAAAGTDRAIEISNKTN